MFKSKFIWLACFLGAISLSVVYGTSIAQELDQSKDSGDFWSEAACSNDNADKQIEVIAKMMVDNEESKEAYICYELLQDANKAFVFEMVAQLRGLSVKELRDEAEQMKRLSQTTRSSAWDQYVERVPFSAVGKPLVSALYYFQNENS